MNSDTFNAFYVTEQDGSFSGKYKKVPFSFLPEHEVLIRVHYSSLNYKDALSATGNKGVTRKYPHIPGIDATGIIESDRSGTYKSGTKVLVTGYDLGSNTPGGYGQYIRVPTGWVVPLPDSLSPLTAMTYGTAGFTAMYGIKRLEREHITPKDGPILVTGATGGVGSLAVFFLSNLGYEVTAATGKMDQQGFLQELGAQSVIHRDEVSGVKDNLLLSGKWNGAIETVGGAMLDAVLRQINPDGAVACCGNILGHQLHTNIYPFILRGLSLLGIDSAICKYPLRRHIWGSIGKMPNHKLPEDFSTVITPKQLPAEIDRILQGKQRGRVVVKHPV